VGTVVATIGSTGVGSLDPLPEILKLKEKYGFRLHETQLTAAILYWRII
jgi:glutamate/tyrosine decarboxylase-like PLP-dependent enzyme